MYTNFSTSEFSNGTPVSKNMYPNLSFVLGSECFNVKNVSFF